jgi:hypothetical protein
MLFTLKNLGRLEEATIDLGKDLIVLTGLNNTSKTYAAHAIYGFCHKLVLLGGELLVYMNRAADGEPAKRIEVDLLEIVDQHLDAVCEAMAASYGFSLTAVFAAPLSFASSTKVEIRLTEDEIAVGRARILAEQTSAPERLLDETIIVDKSSGSGVWTATRMASVTDTRSSERQVLQEQRFFLQLKVVSAFTAALFNGLASPHILTAERSAVEMFSRELAAKRFEARGQDDSRPLYPLALAESLRDAQLMASAQNVTSPYAAEADRLERDILGGSVELGPHGESLFVPAGTKERLDMNLSSSSVKALAGLSFWLRHRAQKGHFLIIDEPELNLHPRNQRLVARLLARLARSGIKVMISTHSDYIVRELNNLLMLHRDKDGKVREKHGYGEDEILDPERIGAYAFDGAHARPIEIGPAGIKVEAFDKDIKELNRSASDIYFSLDEQDAEA